MTEDATTPEYGFDGEELTAVGVAVPPGERTAVPTADPLVEDFLSLSWLCCMCDMKTFQPSVITLT